MWPTPWERLAFPNPLSARSGSAPQRCAPHRPGTSSLTVRSRNAETLAETTWGRPPWMHLSPADGTLYTVSPAGGATLRLISLYSEILIFSMPIPWLTSVSAPKTQFRYWPFSSPAIRCASWRSLTTATYGGTSVILRRSISSPCPSSDAGTAGAAPDEGAPL